jgi:biotin transport system substrate-specific component
MSASVRPIVLADVAVPRPRLAHHVVLIVGASVFTALAAQLEVRLPFTPVPLTGQTFAVLLTGALLGARRAFLAQLLYLAEGCSGLPVFSGGGTGAAHLIGPTGGYLLSFPFAAATVGALASRGWDRRFVTMLAAMLLGSVVVFACGLAGLARFVPASSLLATGLLPFVPGDLVKSTLAAIVFPAVWHRLPQEPRDGRRTGARTF